jgi:pyruvate kinase
MPGRPDHIRTKIVATLGPTTAEEGQLEAILSGGVNVCRLNFSHGTHADHKKQLDRVRGWSAASGLPVAVLGDLCGPKLRLTEVSCGNFELAAGATVRFRAGSQPTTPDGFYIGYEAFARDVREGHRIYIDDGLIRLLVTDRDGDTLLCTCTAGGTVSSRKGVNLPDSSLSTPALTDKDRADLAWAIENGLDYVALSFVRRPEDLDALHHLIRERDGNLGVIIKIEKPEALSHVDYFIAHADGVMVARGDLGVEMDVWRVPLIQKSLTRACRAAGKPVIIATQMLQSMVSSPMPTRAEVSDVANAILDDVDAVMLSAETAAGKYPTRAVEIMRLAAQEAERHRRPSGLEPVETVAVGNAGASAIASGAVHTAHHLGARLVAVWTSSGETVRLVAQYRMSIPVVGLTYQEPVWRRMGLLYGVIPVRVPPIANPAEMAGVLDAKLLDRGLVQLGDLIVVVASTRPTHPGNTDTTLVHRIGAGADR